MRNWATGDALCEVKQVHARGSKTEEILYLSVSLREVFDTTQYEVDQSVSKLYQNFKKKCLPDPSCEEVI